MITAIRPGRDVMSRPGYSLIELAMTLAVFGLVAAAATPFASRAIARARLEATARVVAADVEQAFSLAHRQRAPIRITVSSVAREYTVTDRATGSVYRRRRAGSDGDLRVGSLSASVSTVDIFPNGLASGPLTLTVASSGQSRRVLVTRAGQVRIAP